MISSTTLTLFTLYLSSSCRAAKSSSGGLSVNPPDTNPTTCDPATVTYTYTGNASWPVTIALTNSVVEQYPLGPAPSPPVFKNIAVGLPATGSNPITVNWTIVDVPSGYYVILAEAAPPETYPSNSTVKYTAAEASTDRFQVVNGTSTACLYPNSNPSGGGMNHTGAIVGGVIGGLALLALIALGACFLKRRNRDRKLARKQQRNRQGAVPIEDHKSIRGSEKEAGLGAAVAATGAPSTRPHSTHSQTHEDPFQDPRFTGDFGPSQRSSTLEPADQYTNLAGLGAALPNTSSSSGGALKAGRKPAPEYEGAEEGTEGQRATPSPQQHYLIPDAPVRF